MKPLLTDLQRDCIADHYHGHLIYRTLIPTALGLKQERGVPLDSAELFYVAFFYLDTLLAMPRGRCPDYGRYYLWAELGETLDLRPEGEAEREQARLAVAEVMQTLVHLLTVSRVSSWLGAAQAVTESLLEHVSKEEAEVMETLLWRGEQTVGREDVRDWMSIYVQGQICLSNAIADLLRELAEEERPALADIEVPSTMRFAPNCKTKVLVVLNAMYRAGWFADVQGRPLTNRDKALNDILRLAFGEEKPTQIGSTIRPAKYDNNAVRHRIIINELLMTINEEE